MTVSELVVYVVGPGEWSTIPTHQHVGSSIGKKMATFTPKPKKYAIVHEACLTHVSMGDCFLASASFSSAAAAATAWDGSPTPARVPHPVCSVVEYKFATQ